MKTTAFIDDGLQDESFYRSYIPCVRSAAHADRVIAIMAGPILHCGFLPAQSPESRAEKLARAGADLVVEAPVHGVILKPDTYAYVIAMLLLKMNCVDTLFLPCRRGDAALLEQAAQLMLLSPREYQQALKQLRPGRELYDIIPEAVDRFVPGAEKAMISPMNRFAVEVSNALRLSYCPTKAAITEVDFRWEAASIPEDTDRKLGHLLACRLAQIDNAGLMEIFGSTESRVARLRELTAETFTDFARGLERPDYSLLSARQFLLRIALDFRHISHSMCALHSYIFHVRILQGAGSEAAAELTCRAAVRVLVGNENTTDTEKSAISIFQEIYR